MTIDTHTILCMLAAWLQMHPCLEEDYVRETWAPVFSLLVLQVLPSYLKGFHVP